MKLKYTFIREVIQYKEKLTHNYFYWTEKLTSNITGETFIIVYRSKVNQVLPIGSALSLSTYETVGVYNENGKRY